MSATSPTPTLDSAAVPAEPERNIKQAMWRGWCRKCPKCGTGPLLKGYLRVRDECPSCGQVLSHHRADDGPAYLTILIVGHIMAPVILAVFVSWRPDPVLLSAIFSLGCIAASLYLLPRLKGAIVGLQWAKRMHGFRNEK